MEANTRSEKSEHQLGDRKRKGMAGHVIKVEKEIIDITATDEELERPKLLTQDGRKSNNDVGGSNKLKDVRLPKDSVKVGETFEDYNRRVNFSMPDLRTRETGAVQLSSLNLAGPVCIEKSVEGDTEENYLAFSKRLRVDRNPVKEERCSSNGSESRELHHTVPNPAYPLNSGIAEKTTSVEDVQKFCKTRMSRLVEKQNKETQEFLRSWEQKRIILEKEHKRASALIHSEHTDPVKTKKLKILDKECAKKMEQYKQQKEMALKELKIKHLAARNDESQKEANWLTKAKSNANGENVHNVLEIVKVEPAVDGIPIIKETSPNVVSSNVASLMNSENGGNILDDRIDSFDRTAVPLDLEEQIACTGAGSVPCRVGMNSKTELGAPILELSSRKTDRGDQIHSNGPNVVKKPKVESTIEEKLFLVDGSSLKQKNQSNNKQERNSTHSGKEQLIKVLKKKCDKRMKKLVQRHEKEIQELNRLWDQKFELLEKSHELKSAFTTLKQRHSVRVEEPVVLNSEFADEMKSYKHQKEMDFKDLKQKQLADISEECKKAAHWLSKASEDRADGESSLVGNPETSEDGNQNGQLNIPNTSGGTDSYLASANPLPGRSLDQEKPASDDICTASRSEAIAHDKLFNEKILSGCSNVVKKEFDGANSIIAGNSPSPRQSLEILSPDQPVLSAICDLTLPLNLEIQNNLSQPLSCNVLRDDNNQSRQNLSQQVELPSPEVQSTIPPVVDNQTDLHQASGVVHDARERQPNQSHCADPSLHVIEDRSDLLHCGVEQIGGDLKSLQPPSIRESPVEANPEKISSQETLIHSNLQSEPNLPCQGSDNSNQNELERNSCEREQLDEYYKDLEIQNNLSQPLSCNVLRDENNQSMQNLSQQVELPSPEVQSTIPPVVDNQTDLHQASGVVHDAPCERQPNQSHCADPSLHVVEDRSDLLHRGVEQIGGDLKSLQPLPSRESPVEANPEKISSQETLIHSNLQSEPNLPCQGSDNCDQNELERNSFEREQLDKYYKDQRSSLECEFEKEMEVMMAKIMSKYESNMQDAEKDVLLKKKESETVQNKVTMNKELSEAFRSTHLNPSFLTTTRMKQVMNSSFMEQFLQLPPLKLIQSSSSIAATSSSDIPSASQHNSVRPPPLQVSHQSALFSSIPTRPLTVTPFTPIARNIGNQSNIRTPAPPIRPFQPSACTSSPLRMSSHHYSQTIPPRASPPVLGQPIYPRISLNQYSQPIQPLQSPYRSPQSENIRGNLSENSRLPPMGSLWSPPAAAAATQPSSRPLAVSRNQSSLHHRQQSGTARASTSTPGSTNLYAL